MLRVVLAGDDGAARVGYDEIAAANPGVVLCSISTFGSGERAAALPG